jgi:hypothetical protein
MEAEPITITMDIAEEKRIKRQTYMREYKRKKYAENATIIKDKNKAYYYKTKFQLPKEDMLKYDVLLPSVAKARYYLDLLRDENPELLADIITGYIIN